MQEPNEAPSLEREQFFLHGPQKTVSPDESKVYRHLQRYLLAMIHVMPLTRKELYLDWGCGSGYGTELVASCFKRSIGIERNLDALEYADKWHGRANTLYTTGVDFSDPQNKPDFITCIEVIEHLTVTPAEILLETISRILRPEGTAVFTTPIYKPDQTPNPHHLKEYTPKEFGEMLQKYFSVVEVQDISMGIPNMIAICKEPK